MEREIKFKAWDWQKIIQCWIVCEWKWYEDWRHFEDGISAWMNLMQYTWVKDKNWVEIYEWDIVSDDSQWGLIYSIEFHEACWYCDPTKNYYLTSDMSSVFEVVWNIYE